MITDALLNLIPPGSPLSLVGAAGSTFQSQTIDLLGTGVGTAPQNIIGSRTVFGENIGTDWLKPMVQISVGTAFTTSTSATLNVQFQGSVDSGASGTPPYSPNAWATYIETGAIAVANLTANASIRITFPYNFPFSTLPRFLQLNFVPLSTASFTAGTIAWAVVTLVGEEYGAKYASNNYTVA
jgi:hypothetical protein